MKSDPRDYQLDISSIPKSKDATARAVDPNAPKSTARAVASNSSRSSGALSSSGARPYLSVMFSCCNVYQRVYRDPDGQHYTGRCPKCLNTIKFVIGPGGTAGRSFVVE